LPCLKINKIGEEGQVWNLDDYWKIHKYPTLSWVSVKHLLNYSFNK
jgi:hypothetical protein